jgi:hypothetical protein
MCSYLIVLRKTIIFVYNFEYNIRVNKLVKLLLDDSINLELKYIGFRLNSIIQNVCPVLKFLDIIRVHKSLGLSQTILTAKLNFRF